MAKLRFKRGIVDLASVVWTGLKAGKDIEHGVQYVTGKTKRDGTPDIATINSAGYGFANAINHLKLVMRELGLVPHQLILVKEGMNAKAERQAYHAGYKAGRDHYPGEHEAYNEAVEMVCTTLLDLGAQVCWQDGVEGDDVCGYLAKHLKGERWIIGGGQPDVWDGDDTTYDLERWVVSGDKDLAVLIDPANGINFFRRGEINENPFGRFPTMYIPLYISLVGDAIDKIPGAKGFGEKSFADLRAKFGDEALPVFDHLVRTKQLHKLAERSPKTGMSDVQELKILQKVVDLADQVYMSYDLACLHLESVNTKRSPIEWRVGMCKAEMKYPDLDLRQHAAQKFLVHAGNYDQMFAFIKGYIRHSPYFAFDIETSTPEESDDWIESQPKPKKGADDAAAKMVDVMGSEYTGFSMTFGPNLQYTVYVSVDHDGKDGLVNITKQQAKDILMCVPRELRMYVHNSSFELPVTLTNLGDMRERSIPA